MTTKSLRLLGLIAVAAATIHSQPANGAVYWSTVAPDCTSLAGESPVAITNPAGKTIGYSCYVSGTFVWLAAGGGWSSAIRVAAPASAAIGIDYTFYDASGNNLKLDTTTGNGSSTTSGNEVAFALSANQPAEIGLVGASSDAPKYASTATGSVYAVFYCPDATTCGNVVPQLLYSALPATPWALSVPISWDTELWTQWSAEGIDDGSARRVSLVIYNEDTTATSYTVRVYDGTGSLAGTGTTPLVPPLQPLGNGSLGEGGTYGALLSDVISTRLPAGVFKVLVDGGSKYSAVEVLQFNGQSATALQVAYDSAPGSGSRAVSAERMNIRSARVESAPKRAFSAFIRPVPE
jgi:hypothetical protein